MACDFDRSSIQMKKPSQNFEQVTLGQYILPTSTCLRQEKKKKKNTEHLALGRGSSIALVQVDKEKNLCDSVSNFMDS